MKRRNFLKFFAAPAAIAAVPVVADAVVEEKPEEKPRPQITAVLVKKILDDKIEKCVRYQTYAHNGHDWTIFVQKACNSRPNVEVNGERFASCIFCPVDWENVANKLAVEIEDNAKAMGFRTIWPGLYPEFESLLA